MRRLQLLYTLFCAIWAAYFIRGQISFYLANETTPLRGPILCVLVFVVLPVVLGYVLLFRIFPSLLNRLTGAVTRR